VNFTIKDNLPSGDTGKIVRGAEIDTEFNNIATSVNSKANKDSPTFTGTITAGNLTASDTLNAAGTFQIDGVAITSTAAELNILDGVTATATELNTLDGITASTAELNILDGVTATTAELNILDGVTATTAELNFVDGVTSNIQTQLNTKAASADLGTAATEDVTTSATDTTAGRLLKVGAGGNQLASDISRAGAQTLGTTDANAAVIKTNDAERLRVDSAGNVGIGVAGSVNSSKLTVLGETAINTTSLLDSTATLTLSSPADGTVNQAGIYMRVFDAANQSAGGAIFTEALSTINFRANLVSTYMADGLGGAFIVRQFNSGLASTSERLRIDNAGKLLSPNGAAFVGTVSNSGNGAIIERGSNANGEFVKFADGTLICVAERTYNTGPLTWPATFIDVLYYTNATNDDVAASTTSVNNRTTTGISWITNATANQISFVAFGRWY
jgi:hypothetical protein